jgi:hypothetical protein
MKLGRFLEEPLSEELFFGVLVVSDTSYLELADKQSVVPAFKSNFVNLFSVGSKISFLE